MCFREAVLEDGGGTASMEEVDGVGRGLMGCLGCRLLCGGSALKTSVR